MRPGKLPQRAVEWQTLLESGEITSQADIARREGITCARVTQVLGTSIGLRHGPPLAQPPCMEPTLSLSSAPKLYRTRRPERSPFYAVLYQFFDRFSREYEQRFERTFGPLRGIVPKTVERFFGCGLPEGGFARIRCDICGNEYLVAFSCKQRGFCPSCCAKRAALWVEFVRERVIRPVPHRHLVFALPKVLRPAFRYRRRLLPKLALCAWKALSSFLREDTGGNALPAAIVSIQTAGEFLNWHPHLHVLAPAGAFRRPGMA